MKVKFRHLGILGILGLAVAATTSYASIKKRKSYPATEEPASEEVISSAPGYRGQAVDEAAPNAIATEEPVSQPHQQRLPAPPQPQSQVVTIAPPPPAPAATEAQARSEVTYDMVPADQVEPLIRRLHIIEALVSKYGRAYNYRELTVVQLEAILGQLDTQATQAAELRQRMESRVEMKKEVRQQENAADNSIGSAAPEEYIPAPTQ